MVKSQSLDEALEKIEKVRDFRRGKFYLRDETITMSHGSGGKATHNLVEGLIGLAFSNPVLDRMDDAAVLAINGSGLRLAFTTDSYVVNPLFFPGGDIGKLAIHGTLNDLATSGARPLALSVSLILEEGLPIADLRRVLESMRDAAGEAGVPIVTGDTKVVNRGSADKLYINTAGVGLIDPGFNLSAFNVRPGDRILLSGSVGDHGIAVMMAREALEMEMEVRSDTAPLHELAARLLEAAPETRCLKDPTRGGVATSLNEIALNARVGIAIDEKAVPVSAQVRGACEILGIDPLTIANEGKLICVVPPESEADALRAMRSHPFGKAAVVIGEVQAEPPGMVFLRTEIGGTRVLDMLVGDPLPRIC
ncbi:MAG TPA: hydrogenase expression/formation protein HypE [Anaerolineales bacterium]|nr:hydrogenase expression/formation protein HypE [Anaerolineales bacterium]